MFRKNGCQKILYWPIINNELLIKNTHLIVIQVNGKKRNTITIENTISEKELIENIKNKQLITKYLDSGELLKTIYIKNRLINYIIKQ